MTEPRRLLLQHGDVVAGVTRKLLSPSRPWRRPLPELIANLSERDLDLRSLLMNDRITPTVWRSEFGPHFVYGAHHFHALLNDEGKFSLQETAEQRMRARLNYHIAHHRDLPAGVPRIRPAGADYVYDPRDMLQPEPIAVEHSVFFASPIEPGNWGMWLLNGLPSAHDFAAGRHADKYFCWVQQPWQRTLLHFMGIEDDTIISHQPWRLYRCPAVVMHQYSHIDLVVTERDRAVFNHIAERCGTSPGPEKIFLGRRHLPQNALRRRLHNEDALIAALEERGFTSVAPESMSFPEQVRLFRGARIVVGLGGAALFNCVFCAPGTRVMSIEASTGFAHSHAALFASLGHRYAFMFGRADNSALSPAHSNWSIDVPRAVGYVMAFAG